MPSKKKLRKRIRALQDEVLWLRQARDTWRTKAQYWEEKYQQTIEGQLQARLQKMPVKRVSKGIWGADSTSIESPSKDSDVWWRNNSKTK